MLPQNALGHQFPGALFIALLGELLYDSAPIYSSLVLNG